jgi:hypothetical protein
MGRDGARRPFLAKFEGQLQGFKNVRVTLQGRPFPGRELPLEGRRRGFRFRLGRGGE